MKHRNWFWGIFCLLAAFFVIASQVTSIFVGIGFWSILFTILIAALFIDSIIHRQFFGIFFPAAFLYWIYYVPLKLPHISFWLLMLTALLATIGFHVIFRSHPKWYDHHYDRIGDKVHDKVHYVNQTSSGSDDNHPYAKVSFGSSSRYLHADCLETGQFISSFGSLEVYFDQSLLSPNGAEIYLDCSFGSIELYVPRSWRVKDEGLHVTLANCENNARCQPDANAPVLTLTGNVEFGSVEINYV